MVSTLKVDNILDLQGNKFDSSKFEGISANVIKTEDPTASSNLPIGTTWLNTDNKMVFVCMQDTEDDNIWISLTGGAGAGNSTLDIVDIFDDGSGVALYQLNGDVTDTGGNYDGDATDVTYEAGKFDDGAVSSDDSQITIPLDYDNDIITVSFWFKWNGTENVMPVGFNAYDFYIPNSDICGFNTSNGDRYGIENPFNTTDWFFMVLEFHEGDEEKNKFWLNGESQELSYQTDKTQDSSNAVIKNTDFHIYGWGHDSSYNNAGCIDQVRIFNRALTDDEVDTLYNEE